MSSKVLRKAKTPSISTKSQRNYLTPPSSSTYKVTDKYSSGNESSKVKRKLTIGPEDAPEAQQTQTTKETKKQSSHKKTIKRTSSEYSQFFNATDLYNISSASYEGATSSSKTVYPRSLTDTSVRTSTKKSIKWPPSKENLSKISDTTLNRWLLMRYGKMDNGEAPDEISPKYKSDLELYEIKVCERPLSILSSTISCHEDEIERTLVIVKPNAMQYKNVILKTIFDHGFQIVNQRVVHLTPEQASEIYSQQYGSPTFALLVATVSSAPVLVLSLASLNAVQKWQNIIGLQDAVRREWFFPLSARKDFGLILQDIPDALHGSENSRRAKKENRYFFPDSLLDPIHQDLQKVTDYCDLRINKTLSKGLTMVVKRRPEDPILFLANWLLENNPFSPRLPSKMTTVCQEFINKEKVPDDLYKKCQSYFNFDE